jgi:hypothetical protein
MPVLALALLVFRRRVASNTLLHLLPARIKFIATKFKTNADHCDSSFDGQPQAW